jgi:hypothetical protein
MPKRVERDTENENLADYMWQQSDDGWIGPQLPKHLEELIDTDDILEDPDWIYDSDLGLKANDFTLTPEVVTAANKVMEFMGGMEDLEKVYHGLMVKLESALSEAHARRAIEYPLTTKAIAKYKAAKEAQLGKKLNTLMNDKLETKHKQKIKWALKQDKKGATDSKRPRTEPK